MDSRAVLDLIGQLELRYPTGSWTVDGLRVWPLLRARFYTILMYHFIGSGAQGAGHVGAVGRVARAARSVAQLAWNQLADARHTAVPGGRADAVFLSDGVSLVEVGGEWFDRFMDPIIAELDKRRLKSLLIMPMARPAIPRHTPSFYIQPALDLAKIAATLAARVRPPREVNLEGLEALVEELAALVPGVALPGADWIKAQARRVEGLSRVFSLIIGRTHAKAAFVNTYYSAEGMAFVLAARRLGCTTIDVQHGNQYQHVAYGGWLSVPEEGFELLPDEFWCWSDEEAGLINRGPGGHRAHRAVEVGNVWEQFWSGGSLDAAKDRDEQLKAVRERARGRRNFLVTPSTGHTEAELDLLIETINRSDAGVTWWLRLHPNQIAERAAVTLKLKQAGSDNVELKLATEVPLAVLLDVVDVNVTQASTTVIEARNAGVPSVITTRYGASVFAGEIAQGWARFADTVDEILGEARALAVSKPADADRPANEVPHLAAAVDALFGRHRDGIERIPDPRAFQGDVQRRD